MPLKLILKPGEKIVINQAVIENGGEKAQLILQNKARVMRERDIMTEEKADSPAKRIYFLVQMIYLFPDKNRVYQQKFNDHLRDFVQAVPSSATIALDVGKGVLEGDLYAALKRCKKLIDYEKEVFSHVQHESG